MKKAPVRLHGYCRMTGHFGSCSVGLHGENGFRFTTTAIASFFRSCQDAAVFADLYFSRPGKAMARVTQWIEVRMMPRKVVTFEEFKTYLGRLQKRGLDPLKIPGLPFTEEAFVLWWDRITVSEDLLDRWTRRFQQGEQLMNEPVQETTQTRRVA